MESALQESTPPSSDLFTAWELDNLTAEQLADSAINQKARASLVALSKTKQEQETSVYQEVREKDRLSPELRRELDESLAAGKLTDETPIDSEATESVIDQTFGNEGGSKILNGVGDTIESNLGKILDTTPSSTHITVNKNPGYKGTPNSSVDILDSQGNLDIRRWYGPDGKAIRDVDMSNHGNLKTHPEWPHEHTWEYGIDGKPTGRK